MDNHYDFGFLERFFGQYFRLSRPFNQPHKPIHPARFQSANKIIQLKITTKTEKINKSGNDRLRNERL